MWKFPGNFRFLKKFILYVFDKCNYTKAQKKVFLAVRNTISYVFLPVESSPLPKNLFLSFCTILLIKNVQNHFFFLNRKFPHKR